MRHLHGRDRFYGFWVEGFFFSADSMDDSYQFIHKGDHGLLVTAELFLFTKEVFPEIGVPLHHAGCHLKEDAPEGCTSLFGDTHSKFILSGLFYYWVCACIFYELFVMGEVFYILNLCKEHCCKSIRDTFYGGEELKLVVLLFIYLFNEYLGESVYLWFKEEEFFDVEGEGFSEVGVIDADRASGNLDE